MMMDRRFHPIGIGRDKKVYDLPYTVREDGDAVTVRVTQADMNALPPLETVRLDSDLTTARAGDAGYMFYPTTFRYGQILTRFTEREDASFVSLIGAMPVFGFACESPRAVFVHVTGMDCDCRMFIRVASGVYTISPELAMDGDPAYEDFVVTYTRMPGADYSAMARRYREYQIKVRDCRPLRERVKDNPLLAEAVGSMEIRVRMGWKPRPTPVRRQNLENEPPLHVACNVAQLNAIIDRMQAVGIRHAELCLVGWAVGGHDGRFPQQVPSDPRYGGDEALKAFIARAQSYGYLVVCHTVCMGAYEIADNWDPAELAKIIGPEGNPIPMLRMGYWSGGLNGGDPWFVCPRRAYTRYAVNDLPKVRAYGFRGLHYGDEITACRPVKCHDPAHFSNRKQSVEAYRKIAQLSRRLFGGFQSEAWCDFINADVDFVLYTSVVSSADTSMHPLFDEQIPFWQLVYHGIVTAGTSSAAVNYPIKSRREYLRFVEYGGRPAMYFNSKFGETLNWMGDDDLYDQTPEQLDVSVAALKRAYDDYEALKHLQYEFMEKHERLPGGIARVTYSDGTVITVDHTHETVAVNGVPLR